MAIWLVRLCEANLQQVQSRAEGLGEEHIHLQKQSITTVRVRVEHRAHLGHNRVSLLRLRLHLLLGCN